jgi:SpoVK/Ycf46/Vps4 family AAA+-type ATPase
MNEIYRFTLPASLRESVSDIAVAVKQWGTKQPDEPLAKSFIQYIQQGNVYRPAGKVKLSPSLEPCAFRVESTMEGIIFERVRPATDELMLFEDSPMKRVLEEIDRFWDRKAHYQRLGLMHSRGILLYGPPGNGKSACLQQVVEMMVNRGDVVFFGKNAGTIVEALRAFRQVEPDRRVVVCFEEADELVSHNERALLQLMDGDDKQDNCLYLATTNYIQRLPERMLRPGRFDKKILIPPPTQESRRRYLSHKLKDLAEEAEIDRLAKESHGFGFGHLRELVAGVYAMGEPVNEVLARLKRPVCESTVGAAVAQFLGA